MQLSPNSILAQGQNECMCILQIQIIGCHVHFYPHTFTALLNTTTLWKTSRYLPVIHYLDKTINPASRTPIPAAVYQLATFPNTLNNVMSIIHSV